MSFREDYLESLNFGHPLRIPLNPGHGRQSTLEAWHAQGLPASVNDADGAAEAAYRAAGGSLDWPARREHVTINERMIPEFEEAVLEERGDTRIVRDWKGNVCEISSRFSPRHLRDPIDFVTRRWLKCPVESRSDWLDMRRRYDPDHPARLPADAHALAARAKERGLPLTVQFPGPFWQLREWLGFENLCMLFYDDPLFLGDMLGFWADYLVRLMRNLFSRFVPDEIYISEDMAYKRFAMISPDMVRRHLLPIWRRWADLAYGAGVRIYSMDSDGFVGELIPLWIEAGFKVCDPVEVAAGNDIVAYRKRYGRDMAFRGGIDKREIAAGGSRMEQEISRLEPVVETGGFIPSCDHGVPSDVSWPAFVGYTGRLARLLGWL